MANYNRNENDQNYDYNNDWNENRRRSFDNDYDQNRVSYGNQDYNRNQHNQNRGGYEGYDSGRNYSQGYENNNRGNMSYGSTYGGNVERRERETNQAQGGRYMQQDRGRSNMGMSNDYGYNRGREDYNRDYNTGNQGYGYGYNSSSQRNSGYNNKNNNDRDWWDRTSDEVSSWFGNDEAERRRDMDRRMSGEHRGKGPRGYQRTDSRIQEDICDRLSDDDYIDASDIDIKVENNEVILSGTVQSRDQKRRAEDLVERISGVRHVENRLRVNYTNAAYTNDRTNRRNDDDDDIRIGKNYTGTTDDISSIGNESGTTNEIIRNTGNMDKNK